MNRALIDFRNMSDADLEYKALTVLTAMTGNTNYPTSTTLVTAMQGAKDTYSASLSVARYGTNEQKAQKNADKQTLINIMASLVFLVNFATPNNRVKLLSTGFTVGNENFTPVVMQSLKKFTIVNGKNPGTVIVRAIKGAGTVSINIEYTLGVSISESSVWTTCPDSKNVCNISGLPQGETVWVRVTSVGRRGQILYASPIKTIIL
jgi:hypothetical protein